MKFGNNPPRDLGELFKEIVDRHRTDGLTEDGLPMITIGHYGSGELKIVDWDVKNKIKRLT